MWQLPRGCMWGFVGVGGVVLSAVMLLLVFVVFVVIVVVVVVLVMLLSFFSLFPRPALFFALLFPARQRLLLVPAEHVDKLSERDEAMRVVGLGPCAVRLCRFGGRAPQ